MRYNKNTNRKMWIFVLCLEEDGEKKNCLEAKDEKDDYTKGTVGITFSVTMMIFSSWAVVQAKR